MNEYYSRRPRIKGGVWIKSHIKKGDKECLENEAFDHLIKMIEDFTYLETALQKTQRKYTIPIRMEIKQKEFYKPTIEVWVG